MFSTIQLGRSRVGGNAIKLKQRWNERTRLMLRLELAVILPVAALIGVSVHYLRSIQRDHAVEAAIQRDFSQVLAISEKQINQKAYDLLDDIRMQFPADERDCIVGLDKILAAHPYAAHVFVYYPDNGLVFRSQPDRLRRQMPEILENADDQLSTGMRRLPDFLWPEGKGLQAQIKSLNHSTRSGETALFTDVAASERYFFAF